MSIAGELVSSTVDPRLSGVEGSNGTRLRMDTSVGDTALASGLGSTRSTAASPSAVASEPAAPPPPERRSGASALRVCAPPSRPGGGREDEAVAMLDLFAELPPLTAAPWRWRARLSSGMRSGAGRWTWLRQLLALPAAPLATAGAVAGLPETWTVLARSLRAPPASALPPPESGLEVRIGGGAWVRRLPIPPLPACPLDTLQAAQRRVTFENVRSGS